MVIQLTMKLRKTIDRPYLTTSEIEDLKNYFAKSPLKWEMISFSQKEVS